MLPLTLPACLPACRFEGMGFASSGLPESMADLTFPPSDGMPVPIPGVPNFAVPPPGVAAFQVPGGLTPAAEPAAAQA